MTTTFYHNQIEYPAAGTSMTTLKQYLRQISEGLIAYYMLLLNLGTDVIKDSRQLKYIKICNFVAMMSFAASLIYLVLSIAWANEWWFAALNGLLFSSAAVLILNKMGMVNASRLFYLIAVNTLLYMIALIIGPYTHAENFLLIAVLIPFLMYDPERIRLIVAGVALPVIFLLSYQSVEPYFVPCHLSIAHQYTIRAIGVPMEVTLGIAAVFQFVYYSRKTEIALEKSNQNLTLNTTELKRSNAELEQFAYVISHDLKTPVRNISSFMQLLAGKHARFLNKEANEFVDFAVKSSRRMERLIDDVLAYSRIGRNLSIPSAVNVNDVISTIRYELNGKTEIHNPVITIDKELPVLNNVHSTLIHHLFQNLISNGLKFNTSDKPAIHISWSESVDYFTFSIRDNGIGMSQKYAAQVFQMFKRLHNENEYDGTGIGLAICKKIADHYNGIIWYESEEGKDTTFHFTIRKY